MPVPALFPPLNLDFLTQPLAALGDEISQTVTQARHPVFNATGQEVGYYDTLDAICQGQWHVYQGMAQPPASQIYVVDFWGRRVPLSSQCTKSALANAGGGGSLVFPQTVQPASAVVAQANANDAALGDPAPVDLADLTGPSLDQATLQQYGTYALWGLVGVLGISIIFSDGKRRK